MIIFLSSIEKCKGELGRGLFQGRHGTGFNKSLGFPVPGWNLSRYIADKSKT